jgi:hypothetical protein
MNLADYPEWSWFVSGEPLVWGIDIASGTTFDPDDYPSSESFAEFESDVANHVGDKSDTDWYLEISPTRCYIALDGTPVELETTVDQLAEHGFEVVKYGGSMRPASNGKTYDWFIRLSLSREVLADEQQLRSSLEEVFGSEKTTASVIRTLDDLG